MTILIQRDSSLSDAIYRSVSGIGVELPHPISQISKGAGEPIVVSNSGDRFEDRALQVSCFHSVLIMPSVRSPSQPRMWGRTVLVRSIQHHQILKSLPA